MVLSASLYDFSAQGVYKNAAPLDEIPPRREHPNGPRFRNYAHGVAKSGYRTSARGAQISILFIYMPWQTSHSASPLAAACVKKRSSAQRRRHNSSATQAHISTLLLYNGLHT